MRKLFFYIALLTIFVTSGWGACSQHYWGVVKCGCADTDGACPVQCNYDAKETAESISGIANNYKVASAWWENPSSLYCGWGNGCTSGKYGASSRGQLHFIGCSTQAEADSVACEQEGGQWDGSTCVQGGTTSCETYKAECESMGGKFDGVPLGNGCQAYCDLCEGAALKKLKYAWDLACCNQELTPPEETENQICVGSVLGQGQGMEYSTGCLLSDNCTCGVPLTENLEFDYGEYARQCNSIMGNDQNPTSSSGGNEPGSSSSGTGDSSEVPQVQVMGLEGLMDSLHKIIYNTAEVDTTTQYMLMCMQNPELYCPSLIEDGDTTIVEGDTTIVNVDVPSDSAVIAEVSENVKNQGARTRNILDSMQKAMIEEMQSSDSARRYFDSSANHYRDSLLGIIGAEQIVEGNQTQALLDSVKGKLEGVIGELAGLGDKFDSMSLDLPDTTLDLGGKDTTTIMGTIDSLGTWVGTLISPDSAGGWGTPNAGGGYGDGSGYGFGLGKGSNDSAVGAYGRELKGLVSDTGAIGNVLDTMSSWTEKFDFGAAASTGGCPSFLEKTYSITIAGATFTMGSVGQYLCTPLAGFRTTMWDIGRMVLRAIVSIMCFLWLFRICTNEGKED